MTIHFKKVRNFEKLELMQDIERDLLKGEVDDIYVIDNREVDVDPDEIRDYALVEGYMNA